MRTFHGGELLGGVNVEGRRVYRLAMPHVVAEGEIMSELRKLRREKKKWGVGNNDLASPPNHQRFQYSGGLESNAERG